MDDQHADPKIAKWQAELQELRTGRQGVLAEFADQVERPEVAKMLDGFDQRIKVVEKHIERHAESQTAKGKADAAAALARQLAAARATLAEVVQLLSAPAVENAEAIGRTTEHLRELLEQNRDMRVHAVRALHQALKPLAREQGPLSSGRSHMHSVLDLARAPHATADALLAMLQSREVREMNLTDHAQRHADRLNAVAQKLLGGAPC